MAATITIVCPKCGKKLKGPAEVKGRKIRCKGCTHVFIANDEEDSAEIYSTAKEETLDEIKASGADTTAAADKKAAAPAKNPDGTPVDNTLYDFTGEKSDVVPRCPQCAFELESAEAIVCLHCGYNLLTRVRLQMVKTFRITFWDWVFWLTPPISAAIVCLVCIFAIVFFWLLMPRWFAEWWFNSFALQVWGSVFFAYVGWSSGKYAFKRLVCQFRPPEKMKR